MRKLVNGIIGLIFLIIIVSLVYISFNLFNKNNVNVIEEEIVEEELIEEEIIEEELIEEEIIDEDNNDIEETFMGFTIDYKQSDKLLNDLSDIDIVYENDRYSFTYNDQLFYCEYTYDNWTIYDSYRVRNTDDMEIICEALININPIHGSDMQSYRSSKDMAYEWLQHNIAYELLPESDFKNNAKNVDFDPEDQGKSLEEIYRSRYQ